ncbi:hypothetical protein ACOSP7_013790 [Xanthoceras sorbifolium]
MFIKTKISDGICGSVDQQGNVRDLLKGIDEQLVTSEKALASTLIMKLSSLRLTSVKGVHEHIMKMRDIAAQLKKLEVNMSESFLVHYILNTLSQQYGPFKILYNTHKNKWSINELMTMYVQEKGRLLIEQGDSVMLATQERATQANQKGKVSSIFLSFQKSCFPQKSKTIKFQHFKIKLSINGAPYRIVRLSKQFQMKQFIINIYNSLKTKT